MLWGATLVQYCHCGPSASYSNGRNHDQDSSDPVVLVRWLACKNRSMWCWRRRGGLGILSENDPIDQEAAENRS